MKAKRNGTVGITARTWDGSYIAICKITVGTPVTSVKINTTARTLERGKTFQLAAWPQPANASNKAVTWTSSNPDVVKVWQSGVVTAVKAGNAVITVKTVDGGFTATCKITVVIPVTSVKINTTAKTLEAGKTFQLAAWPQPANASNKAVTWSSSNPDVAKVWQNGVVTAVKAGTANITVKTVDGGFTKTCKITVNAPVKSVKINSTARTLEPGKTFQLAAWPQPVSASNKAVTWTSNDSSVAKVSSTGLVTAVTTGTADVTVKTVDGGYTETCKITVVSLASYAISAPTNVHWTNGFKVSWTFGKTQDGTVYHRYGYRVYDVVTGKKLNNYHGKMNLSGTSVSLTLSSYIVEQMQTGSYYFTVYPEDYDHYQIGPEVRSEAKAYTRPSEKLPAPVNLRWEGINLLYDIPGNNGGKVDNLHYYLMYCETENGTFEFETEGTCSLSNLNNNIHNAINRRGYYKCRIELRSIDPQVIMPSSYSEFSPVTFIEVYHGRVVGT